MLLVSKLVVKLSYVIYNIITNAQRRLNHRMLLSLRLPCSRVSLPGYCVTDSLSLRIYRGAILIFIHAYTLSHIQTLIYSLSYTHTLILSLIYIYSYTLSHILILILSLSYTLSSYTLSLRGTSLVSRSLLSITQCVSREKSTLYDRLLSLYSL